MSALAVLDALLSRLDGAVPGVAGGEDAIGEVLSGPPRETAVRRLADDAVMQRFRQELAAGRVEAVTVRGFLDLVGQVLDVVLAGRGPA